MILAIDQGTTGTTALVVDEELRVRGRAYRAIEQHYPRPGWVEHDPEELWESVQSAARAAAESANVVGSELQALGLTNQRETTVLWNRRTGRPVANAIVWQDRRTAVRCAELPSDRIREITGLPVDPYFSATKLEWLLKETKTPARDLAFGTVDSWLAWKLTGGEAHVSDLSNASRTMLLELEAGAWSEELLELFRVERSLLPNLVPSSGVAGEALLLNARIPIASIAGDQQSALFGQSCIEPGQTKVTYGTGSFVLINTGNNAGPAPPGLVRTIAWALESEEPVFALEGSIFITGAAIQWLIEIGLIASPEESEEIARSIDGNGGVYFVPALSGLGSPHWNPDARGLITGITGATRREHVVRAALEAIAYQTNDVIAAAPEPIEVLRADGGAAANRFLLQFQADIADLSVEVPAERETTAIGAAALAGLGVGMFSSPEEIESLWRPAERYEPQMPTEERDCLLAGWSVAVERTLV